MFCAALTLLLVTVAFVMLSIMVGRGSALAHKQKQIERRAKRLNVDFYWDQSAEPLD